MKVELEGFANLEKALAGLPANIGKAVARRAIKEAGEQMADRQRALAPVDDGELRDSINVKVRSRALDGLSEYGAVLQAGGSKRAASQALRKAKRQARDNGESLGNRITVTVGAAAPHAHLIEFGTKPRKHKKTGKSTGAGPAKPFIRPAFDAGLGDAVTKIGAGLEEEIAKASARIARKAARAAKG